MRQRAIARDSGDARRRPAATGSAGSGQLGGGCSAFRDLPTTVSLAVGFASPGGSTSAVFQLPANPAFVGFRIGYQSLVLDAGAPIGFTTSNALDVVFDF